MKAPLDESEAAGPQWGGSIPEAWVELFDRCVEAIDHGETRQLKKLLLSFQKEVSPEDFLRLVNYAHRGQTPLLTNACCHGNVEASRFLLKVGADPNRASTTGKYPLLACIEIGSIELVRLLCDNGADPNFIPHRDSSYNNRSALAHVILQNGEEFLPDPQRPPLREWKNELLKLLLYTYHADPNVENSVGTTPLFWCAIMDDVESAHILIEAGADIKHKNHMGKTALDRAYKNGAPEFIRVFGKKWFRRRDKEE